MQTVESERDGAGGEGERGDESCASDVVFIRFFSYLCFFSVEYKRESLLTGRIRQKAYRVDKTASDVVQSGVHNERYSNAERHAPVFVS